MKWAVKNKPHLVGHTQHPALHWWTPRNTRKRLKGWGFVYIWDRWDLRLPTEDTGFRGLLFKLISGFRLPRVVGDIVFPGCSYAARKCQSEYKGTY